MLTLVLVSSAWRAYGYDSLVVAASRGAAGERPISQIYGLLEAAMGIAPEASAAERLAGQALLVVGHRSTPSEQETWYRMASAHLVRAARANPADGSALLSLALVSAALGENSRAVPLAVEAVARRPGYVENAWVLARQLPAKSPERQAAYRIVTRLEPRLTPKVVAEVGAEVNTEADLRSYVAPTAAAYRAWAWSVSDATQGIRIAEAGLGFADEDASQDAAWLAYYIGLKHLDSAPGEALEWLSRAAEGAPGEQAFHRNHGFALLKTGRPNAAKEAFERSIAIYGDVANAAHLGRAQADEVMGNSTQALRTYRRLTTNQRLEDWVRNEAGQGVVRLERKLREHGQKGE